MIIEDGTGVAGANSYMTTEEATAYHTTFGNTGWPSDTQLQETALIYATLALDANYGCNFDSFRLQGTQELLWPRYQFYDRDMKFRAQNTIPKELKYALAEMALLYFQGADLYPQDSKESSITEEAVSVGEIKTMTKYANPTKVSPFRKIDMLLRPVLKHVCRGATFKR